MSGEAVQWVDGSWSTVPIRKWCQGESCLLCPPKTGTTHTRTHTVYKSQPVLLFSCKTEASLPVSFCSSIELSGIRLPPPSCTIPRSRSDTTPTHRSLQPTRSVIHTYSLVSYSVTEVESFYRCTCLQEFNCLQKLPTHLLAASLCFLSLLHLTCHVPLCLDEKPYKWIN